MELGAFSVSLAVKDIEASREFYTKFGFRIIGGDASENWLILQNGAATIGLFQGMFEKNILTFKPRLEPRGPKTRRLHRHPQPAASAQRQGRRPHQ